MDLKIGQRPGNRGVMRLVKTLEKRVSSIEEHYSYDLAVEMLPYLQGMAPADIPRYAKLLRVTRLKMAGLAGAAVISVPGYAHHSRLSESDAQRTAIYVKPKMVAGKAMDPGAVVLWRSNPWTMDTLPYEPSKRAATLISRRVKARVAGEIDRARKQEMPAIERELRSLGVVLYRKHPVLIERRVVRDLATEVMNRELGLGDDPHVSHWRPAIRYAKTVLAKGLTKRYLRWLAVVSNRQWKQPIVQKAGKVSDAVRVQGFQSHIRA